MVYACAGAGDCTAAIYWLIFATWSGVISGRGIVNPGIYFDLPVGKGIVTGAFVPKVTGVSVKFAPMTSTCRSYVKDVAPIYLSENISQIIFF